MTKSQSWTSTTYPPYYVGDPLPAPTPVPTNPPYQYWSPNPFDNPGAAGLSEHQQVVALLERIIKLLENKP